MKFIIILLVLTIGVYFEADYLLSSHLRSTPSTKPEDEKALVQNMAKFLEKSPDLQKKIQDSGQTIEPKSGSYLSNIDEYFRATPTDQYFKKYLIDKMKLPSGNSDEHAKIFVAVTEYIHAHPKEAVESLEYTLQYMPLNMLAEREALIPAFIHSSINFIEELDADEQTKKIYLKRFIDNIQAPEVKDALENHFPDLLL